MALRPDVTLEAANAAATGACRGCSAFASRRSRRAGSTPSSTSGREILAPNGYLHAATVVALADTACGYGCLAHLPADVANFTTDRTQDQFPRHRARGHDRVRRASRAPGRARRRSGTRPCARKDDGKTIALFRCTQMILYPAR